MPKGRYKIMTDYMPKVGKYGLDMMYRTCTVQTNLDFSSEADMVKKLRVSVALQPVATALFANSPFTEGKPNGFLSFRSEIWRDTDNARSGMMPWAFEHGMGFERWVDYALDVPMYFVKRGDNYIDVAGLLVPRFLRGQECRVPRRASDDVGLGQSSLHDLPGSAPQALSGNARRRWRAVGPAAGAAGVLGRPLYDDVAWMRPGTWSTTGPRRSASRCATTSRASASRPGSGSAICSRSPGNA